MSLSSALYNGISGISTSSQAMTVIGNNIANINTTGFKASRLTFEDILNQHLSSGSTTMKSGRGVTVSGISPMFTQGSLESTSNPTDLAIDGQSFFIVSDGNNRYFTRAGNFIINQEGNLVNPAGLVVQGWQADRSGSINTSSTIGGISVLGVASAPFATSQITLGLNLDAASENEDRHTSSFVIYDSKGKEITLNTTFTFSEDALLDLGVGIPARHWAWNLGSSDGAVSADSKGYFTFDLNGQLSKLYDANGNELTTNPLFEITNLTNGAEVGEQGKITWNIFDKNGKSKGNITSYASNSVTTSMQQNGYTTGALQSLSVENNGVVTGLFTNGQIKKIAQVAVADFLSPWGLNPIGSNLFAETLSSGQPLIGVAGTAGKGEIKPNSLEQANVDLAAEFVKMITTQRGFQANSRVITTTDDMFNEVVNLKR